MRKPKKRKLSGVDVSDIVENITDTYKTKLRYDYERSLTPQERQQRYDDSKKVTRNVVLGVSIAIILGVAANIALAPKN